MISELLRSRQDTASAQAAQSHEAPRPAGTAPTIGGNKVLVTTEFPQQRTAWTKARIDVIQLAEEAGYETVVLPAGTGPREWLQFASQLRRSLSPGGHILLEYPIVQRKRLYLLHLYRLLHQVRLYGLIHDLDSLRYDSPPSREIAILKLFDGLISHNRVMTGWLRQSGITRPIVDLNLFDYRCPASRTWHEDGISSPLKVLCAGNLSFNKAGYLYDPALAELQGVELSLYGAFYDPARVSHQAAVFKGVFDPSAPMLDGPYHFGLIWDGSGARTCEGAYGHYMRFNNPHKLSLYVSLGLPVVVWKEAAIAHFVLEQGIGVVVSDLRELGELSRRVSSEDYRRMAANILPLSHEVRRGAFLGRALDQLVA